MEGDRRFCGKCGAAVAPGMRFCERCGAPFEPSVHGAAPSRPPVSPTVPIASTPAIGVPQSSAESIAGRAAPGHGSAPGWSSHAGSGYGAASSHGGSPPVLPVAAPRRWWAGIPLALVVLIVSAALVAWFGFPLATRQILASQGLRTGVGKSRVAGFPAERGGPPPRFQRRLVKAPPGPSGLSLATPVYRVDARTATSGPYEISLPLLNPDTRRRVVVARRIEGGWEPLPTERDGAHVIAATRELSTFAGWFAPRRAAPTEAQRSRLRIPAPRLLFGRVAGDTVTFHVDVRGLATAYDPARPWVDRVIVRGLSVEMARPTASGHGPFEPYGVEGGPLLWSPTEPVGVVPVALAPLPASFTQASLVRERPWRLRIRPVFEDRSVGEPSEPTELFPDVLRAYAWLGRNAPWPEAQRAAFQNNLTQHPLTVIFGGYLEDAYSDALPWSRELVWGRIRAGVSGPHIGLTLQARWGEVVTHEWGHYAVHMALGDPYYEAQPATARAGWTERTRTAAFGEDLATFLGQWSTGGGLPASTGAMLAHPFDLARHPRGAGTRWPASRDVDAVAVETVSATVMSRIARDAGPQAVLGAVLAARPTDLLGLSAALLAGPHREVTQRALLEEGVSWRVRGRVVARGAGTPIAGARVQVRVGEATLSAPAEDAASVQERTDASGHFVVRVPPGTVELVVEADGHRAAARTTFSVDTAGSTAGAPQPLPGPIELEHAG